MRRFLFLLLSCLTLAPSLALADRPSVTLNPLYINVASRPALSNRTAPRIVRNAHAGILNLKPDHHLAVDADAPSLVSKLRVVAHRAGHAGELAGLIAPLQLGEGSGLLDRAVWQEVPAPPPSQPLLEAGFPWPSTILAFYQAPRAGQKYPREIQSDRIQKSPAPSHAWLRSIDQCDHTDTSLVRHANSQST